MERTWRRRKLLGIWNKHHTRVNRPFSSKRWKKLQCIKFVFFFNTTEPMFKQLSISSLNHIILIFYVLPIARKKQGLLKIEVFYDCTQMSSVGIFQYPTSSQSNKKRNPSNNRVIYRRSIEALTKRHKLSNSHIFTQIITLA